MIRLYSVILLLFTTSIVHAANVFIEGGLHIGGDDVVTVTFVGGDTQTIKAGELLSGSIGIISSISESAEIRASFGLKFDGIFAENGDAEFTRFPLELMVFTKGEQFSFGAGISYHLSPEFSASGPIVGPSRIDFDDAMGFVAEIDYKLGERGYLGLKGTVIDYEATGLFGGELSGNSIGVVIGVRFK